MTDEKRRELAIRVIDNVIERLVNETVMYRVDDSDYRDAAYKIELALFKLVKDND